MLYYIEILIAILFFGFVTSYTDVRYGKIKNHSVILLIAAGIILNILVTGTIINKPVETLLNSLIALAVGILLWSTDIWSTGDAKLFFAFSVLLPISIYNTTFIPFFPSFTLLVNTFIPVALFYFLTSLHVINLAKFKQFILKTFTPKSFLDTLLYIAGFTSFMLGLNAKFNINLNLLFHITIFFLAIELIKKVKINNFFTLFSLVLLVIGAIMSPTLTFSLKFIEHVIMLVVAFQVIITVFNYLSEFSFNRSVKISLLKSGMILGESITREDKKYVKNPVAWTTPGDIINSVRRTMSERFSGKLTDDDVEKIQKLSKEGKLDFREIKVAKIIPFAPFMFLGVLVTFFLRENLLFYFVIGFSYLTLYIKVVYYKLLLVFGLYKSA